MAEVRLELRVAIIGQDFEESFSRYIARNLRKMGHEAEIFVPLTSLIAMNVLVERVSRLAFSAAPAAGRAAERRVSEKVNEWEPDLVISNDGNLWPSTVQAIKKRRAPVVLWFPDALVNTGRQFMFVSGYDRLFFKDPYFVRYCTEISDLPAELLPEACDPDIHYPVEPVPEELDELSAEIAFVGNIAASRVSLLEHLLDYDLRVWTRIFPRWIDSPVEARWRREFLVGEKKAKVFRSSKVVLNSLHFGEIEGTNCRFFEAAACGAFQVAEWRASMSDFFADGREIVYYRSVSELREVIDHYLPLETERRAIGDAASSLARSEHTYEKRLSRLIEVSC